jgi:hypothetical protein
MNYVTALRLIVFASLLALRLSSHAQDPLSVEVLGPTHRNWDAITVQIKNVTSQGITLTVTFNIPKNGSHTVLPIPIDVERKEGTDWKICLPSVPRLRPRT